MVIHNGENYHIISKAVLLAVSSFLAVRPVLQLQSRVVEVLVPEQLDEATQVGSLRELLHPLPEQLGDVLVQVAALATHPGLDDLHPV